MSEADETGGEHVIDATTAVIELVQDAAARLNHLIMDSVASIGPDERRELEEAAEDLRAALQYLDRKTRTHDPSGHG